MDTKPPSTDIQNPSEKKSVSQKKYVIVGLIVLVILCVLVLWGASASQKSPFQDVTSANPSPTVTLTPTPNPTANWQTYQGNGFSFQYPEMYIKQSANQTETHWEVKDKGTDQMILRSQNTPFPTPILNKPLKLLAADHLIQQIGLKMKVAVNGIQADNFVINCGSSCYVWLLRFQKGNTYYELSRDISYGDWQTTNQEIMDSFTFSIETPAPSQ